MLQKSTINKWIIGTLLFCSTSVMASSLSADVSTEQGQVKGVIETQGTMAWLGIPYASSPAGNQRWQIAQPAAAYQGKFHANKQGNLCPQIQNGTMVGSEDCLNLNIYRPANTDILPVLVYIHGGNNQAGKADEFNPRELALSTNAVVVTVNYRLGVLGFNPLAAVKGTNPVQASGNFSLLDQATALDWLHNNVKAFHGDATKITIAGFSAGGRDVMAMLISPIFKDKFKQAIVFSGGMTTSDMTASQHVYRQAFAKLVMEDGLAATMSDAEAWLAKGDKTVTQYLYHLDTSRLVGLMQNAAIRMSAFPHLYRDGAVIPKAGFDTTAYNSVPVMMVTGRNEFSFFALGDPYFSATAKSHQLFSNPVNSNGYRFAFHYGGMLYSLFNVDQSARKMAPHYHAPIYGAEIAYGTNPLVSGETMKSIGSFHGVFLPLIDASLQLPMFGDAFKIPGAKALSHQFKQYLQAFIHQGDPNVSTNQRWKPWSLTDAKHGESLMVLDANKNKAICYMSQKNYQYKDVLTQIKQDHSISETQKQAILSRVLNGRWFSAPLDHQFKNKDLWQ